MDTNLSFLSNSNKCELKGYREWQTIKTEWREDCTDKVNKEKWKISKFASCVILTVESCVSIYVLLVYGLYIL